MYMGNSQQSTNICFNMNYQKVSIHSALFSDSNCEQRERYRCPNCYYLLKDAVQVSCGHWMCLECAEDIFEENSSPCCPRQDCKEALELEDGKLFFPDKFVRKEINKFPVRCRNYRNDCPWTGTLIEIIKHMEVCITEQCECQYCGEMLSASQHDRHVRMCPKAITYCPFAKFGCEYTNQMTRTECDKHSASEVVTHSKILAANLTKLIDMTRVERIECLDSEVSNANGTNDNSTGDLKSSLDSLGDSMGLKIFPSPREDIPPIEYLTKLRNEATYLSEEDLNQYDDVARLTPHPPPRQQANALHAPSRSTNRDESFSPDNEYDEKLPPPDNSKTGSSRSVETDGKTNDSFRVRGQLVERDGPPEGAAGGTYLPQSKDFQPFGQSLTSLATKLEVEALKKVISDKDSKIQHLQDKLQRVESTVQAKSSENEDRDFQLSLMENSNFDGSMVWKIPQFSQRMEDARTKRYLSLYSPPFYSARYGYKMCLRLYILGDGIGKGSHMSLFFVLMKGEFDNILQWPFTHKVTFKLINRCGGRDIVDIFQPDPLSSSFQKPKTDMNVASGCPRFVSLNELMQGGFILDDTVYIKVKADTTTMRHP